MNETTEKDAFDKRSCAIRFSVRRLAHVAGQMNIIVITVHKLKGTKRMKHTISLSLTEVFNTNDFWRQASGGMIAFASLHTWLERLAI